MAMTSRQVILGVLHNFLGTFTSRYSDFDGYWVFGFLVESMDAVRIDLLADVESANSTPSGFIRWLAVQRFSEQIAKAGLSKESFREAYLDILKVAESKVGFVNGQSSSGYDVRFKAHAITDLCRAYDSTISIFVAPHDPKIELRSTRAV
jgi:hypothetical protein